jgi:hypothetical protein
LRRNRNHNRSSTLIFRVRIAHKRDVKWFLEEWQNRDNLPAFGRGLSLAPQNGAG